MLGYSFNPQSTDDSAACLVISDTICCMLLTTGQRERFVPKGKTIADATKTTESLLALSTDSKDAVNALFDEAIAAGARKRVPRKTMVSCTAAASTTWMDTSGKCSGSMRPHCSNETEH